MKFNCEIDTVAKTAKFYIDGKEVPVEHACLTFCDIESYDMPDTEERYCSISYCDQTNDGTDVQHSINFTTLDKEDPKADASVVMANATKKAMKMVFGQKALTKVLKSKHR